MKKGLIEKKNSLITRADEMMKTAKEEKRELTEAEAKELAEIRDDVKKIKEQLGLIDEIEAEKIEEVTEETEEKREESKEQKEHDAFENFLRNQVIHERAGELDPASGGNGEAIIPTSIAKKIISKVYEICPILEASTKYNVKGNIEIPVYGTDQTNTGIICDYASEFVELTSTSGKFTTVDLTGFLAGALTKVSKSLINNTDFDIVSFVVEKMAEAIARFVEHELLVGTTNKVEGLSSLTNTVTTASATAIIADEVIDLQDAIVDRYQGNAFFIMSKATRNALRKLKLTTGEYLLNKDMTAAFGYTLLGKDVYISDNMPEIGAGHTAIYYGDFSGLATKLGEEIDVEVLRERFATEHAVGVVGWIELDSKVEDNQKIAALVCKSA